MNHVYRLVWSQTHRTWIAVSEISKGRKKGGSGKLAAATLCLATVVAQAAPGGGQVVSGSGQISNSGNTTTVTQSSQNLSLNWRSFNIAPQETVNFVQPSASAVAVNRIFDTNGTQILGHLNANGQVYLINPNGILFGRGSVVNVGGLVASTLNPTDADPSGATRSFSGSGTGSVTNEGTITAAPGGYVALLGNHVTNTGAIVAQMGTVGLGAGSAVTLTFDSDHLVGVQVDRSTLNNVAANGGLIQADGGKVVMTAGARDALLASAVNNTGVVEARTVEDHDGTITLLAGMSAGQVNVGGTLDASAPNGGNGGAIETSGAHVSVANNTRITTQAPNGLMGSWLVDPQDFTVAASGGDITGNTLSGELATTNVTLESSAGTTAGSGNLNVNDAVTWSTNSTLTLTASNNVNINANITATNATAGLVISPNTANGADAASGSGIVTLKDGASITLSGASPTLFIEGQQYTVINSLGVQGSTTGTDLQGINTNPGFYALGTDIDASATQAWNSGQGFTPISSFNGVFSGLGHTISGLFINRPTDSSVGLFGSSSGYIANVSLSGGSVTGGTAVGALVGHNYGTITVAHATGTTVSGSSQAGGLTGTSSGTVSDSYATGTVSGTASVGGLVGTNYGLVTNSYATGGVSGSDRIGGLVGLNRTGTISNSYASGAVTGAQYAGGLVGYNNSLTTSTTISDSYASGSVTGTGSAFGIGGLVGFNYSGGGTTTISNSYANGAVSAGSSTFVGGLIGDNLMLGGGTTNVTNSFWDVTTTGQSSSAGSLGTGLTTAQMQQQSSFTGWDFTGTWVIYEGHTDPLLRSFLTPLTVTANDDTRTYNAAGYSGGNGVSYSITPGADLLGTPGFTGSSQGAVDVGSYTITPQGLYSNQQGYLISYANGTLTINPAALTITGTAVTTKTYDRTTTATLTGGTLVGVQGSDVLTLTQSGTFASANAGTGISVTASDSIGGTKAGNYTLTQPTALTGDITPAALTVTGTSVSNKVYDGNTTATLTGGALSGVIGPDVVTLTQAGAFSSKNAGTGIGVTASDSLGGAAASNYTLTQPTGLTADITQATLTITGTSVASNKVYDGTTAATLTGGTLSGVIGSDAVTLVQGGTFASANAGTGITVTGADSLSGTAAGNYVLAAQPTGLSANITPATLTVSGTSASNKVYDGTLSATLTGGTLSGIIGSDSVTLTQAGTFASQNVGTGVSVTATDSLGGTAAGNYTLTQPTGLTANITPATLTVTGTSVTSKVYDGTAAATLTGGALSGVIGSDVVTLAQGGSFASANAGTGIAVTASDSLGGAGASNYTLTQPTGLSGVITPATLTIAGTSVANKVYDGTTAATLLGGTLSGVIGSDAVTLVQGGTLASANAGIGIAVTASDSLSGTAAGNYVLAAQPTGLTANITPATLTYIASPSRTLTGKTPGGLNGTVTGFVSGDTLASATNGTLSWTTSATESSPAGSYDIDGSGLSASNYVFAQAAGNATALTVSAAGSAPIPAVAAIESSVLQSSGPTSAPAVDQSFDRDGKAKLVIVDLGVKLPSDAIGTH